jgi:hypothetical protein
MLWLGDCNCLKFTVRADDVVAALIVEVGTTGVVVAVAGLVAAVIGSVVVSATWAVVDEPASLLGSPPSERQALSSTASMRDPAIPEDSPTTGVPGRDASRAVKFTPFLPTPGRGVDLGTGAAQLC